MNGCVKFYLLWLKYIISVRPEIGILREIKEGARFNPEE